jgi:ketosteroid isomerase-like protein
MSAEQLNKIAMEWFDAFNAKDLERLLDLYHDDALHYSPKLKVRQPETKGLIQGKNTLRAWWKDAFSRLPDLRYEVVRLTPFEDRVFMEYKRHVSGEEELYVGEMLEMKDGLIAKSAVFHA